MKNIISLFAFAVLCLSCKKKDVSTIVTDGISLNESIFVDTFSVKTSVVLDDYRVTTENLTFHSVGSFVDEYYGLSSANVFFKLEDKNQLVEDDNVDSAFVQFSYSFFVQGDTTKTLDLELYETTESFIDDSSYTHKSDLKIGSTSIGALSFVPNPISGTTVSVRVSNDWISSYKKRDVENSFDGKALCIKAKDGTDASIISFDKSSLKLLVYGKNGGQDFTKNVDLNTTNNFDKHSFDRSSTTISGILKSGDIVSTTSNKDRMLVQSGSGVCSKIELEGLRQFLKDNPSIQIDKAELVFQVDEMTTGGANAVAPKAIKLYQAKGNVRSRDTNQDLDGLILPDNSVYSSSKSSFYQYDESKLTYALPFTSYLRSVVSEKKELSDLILFAQYGLNDIDLNGVFSVGLGDVFQITHSVVLYNENAIATKKPKVNIYYTITK